MLPLQAIDMIRGKNIILLMDSHLEGNFSTEEATLVVGLASQCLQYEPRERPSTEDLVTTLAPLQTKPDVRKFKLHHLFWFYSYQFKLFIPLRVKYFEPVIGCGYLLCQFNNVLDVLSFKSQLKRLKSILHQWVNHIFWC